MKTVRNQRGIALVTALMFTLLCLGIIMALMYLVLAGTRMSGAQKRYRNALEASYGGTELITRAIIPRLFDNYSTGKTSLLNDFGSSATLGLSLPSEALPTKLRSSTSAWPSDLSRTPDPKVSPDVTFLLRGESAATNYRVYGKIVNTVAGVGLIDTSGVDYLDAGLGVAGTSSSTQTPRTPNIYTIEVQAEAAERPMEKSQLSVLYSY